MIAKRCVLFEKVLIYITGSFGKKEKQQIWNTTDSFFLLNVLMSLFQSAHGPVSNIRSMRELQPFKGHRIIHGWWLSQIQFHDSIKLIS